MSAKLTEQEFLKEVEQHVMTVVHDIGVFRLVRFKRPDTICEHFDLITWPGHLCYSGDMGTYVFTRLQDMFEFFRAPDYHTASTGKKLHVNLGYWSEKLVAVDGNRTSAHAMEFSEEKFKRTIDQYVKDWTEQDDLDEKVVAELRSEIDQRIMIDFADMPCEHEARRLARDFGYTVGGEKIGSHRYQFTDFHDHDLTVFTHRFQWCCFALAWGIQQYDAAKAEAVPA